MKTKAESLSIYEFFSGGGMVRAGLGPNWRCLFANDYDHKKNASYIANWGDEELITGDVRNVNTGDLPGTPDFVWASFPCQDLSLAGIGAGLRGERSGTFWPFWDLMRELISEGRTPRSIILENVCGTLTSHGGKDFNAIAEALVVEGYNFGAIVIDAALFVPQSRKRLFIIAIDPDTPIPRRLKATSPTSTWHTRSLRIAYDRMPTAAKRRWVWWNLVPPKKRTSYFADLIEDNPSDVDWFSMDETAALIQMMSPVNLAKVQAVKKMGTLQVGTVYKRTRRDRNGNKVQRAEVRLDGIAGCLRTPAGGSSRQIILVIKGDSTRSRLISARETARLMGLHDSYRLPDNYNEAYYLTGDGVVVPVVRYISVQILEPILIPEPITLKADEYACCSVQTKRKVVAAD